MLSPLQGQTITLFSNPMFLDCGRDRPDYTDTRGRCKLRTAYPESICRESLSCSIFFWPLSPKPTACWEVTYSALWSQNHTCNPYAKKKRLFGLFIHHFWSFPATFGSIYRQTGESFARSFVSGFAKLPAGCRFAEKHFQERGPGYGKVRQELIRSSTSSTE